jgi:NAD(P)-dependent dehydrogenase (short-subunit alcohol dehydrogenase family)
MPRADLPTMLGPREVTVVAVAPGMIRLDVQSDEDEFDRASVIRDVAWLRRLIRDMERAEYEAVRMEP